LEGEMELNEHKEKIINDPIHGHIEMPSYCVDMIDTPQFQRLRDLKQLGVSYLIFPGASHNRFEHCLGVSHLAGTLLNRFRKIQPNLGIDDNDIKCIQLAGLCHDLGHGPFSHSFEKWMRRIDPDFHHENKSKELMRYAIDENGIDHLEEEDILFIEELISGKKYI